MRAKTLLSETTDPTRTCAGCGQTETRAHLLRIVAEPTRLRIDYRCALPGRGTWVHYAPTCVVQARKRRSVFRLLRLAPPAWESYDTEEFWEELHCAVMSEAPGA